MGSYFPELDMWKFNFRDTKYSLDSAKYTLFLNPHSCLSCNNSWLKRQVNSDTICTIKSRNESIFGHLTRTKITETHYACTTALPPKPAQVASATAYRSGSSSHIS